jgi:hypothetical protein
MNPTNQLQFDSYTLTSYAHVGTITRADERGFGFVSDGSTEYFLHVTQIRGPSPPTMADLRGTSCAFNVGGNPRRFLEKKPEWQTTVVDCVILPQGLTNRSDREYHDARGSALDGLSLKHLQELLAAAEYTAWWHDTARCVPQATLRPDARLLAALRKRLSNSANLTETVDLLCGIAGSPWFATTPLDGGKAVQSFFRPSEWAHSTLLSVRPLTGWDDYHCLTSTHCPELHHEVLKASAVAIDIESDGKRIFEVGWRTRAKHDGCKEPSGLSTKRLKAELAASTLGLRTPCLVGHKLLDWDLPVLAELGVRPPENATRWDTLFASWLLAPWEPSHALVVPSNAHTAKADAEACYALFKDQIERLANCISNDSLDIEALVESFLADPSLFEKIPTANTPVTYVPESRRVPSSPGSNASDTCGSVAAAKNCWTPSVAQPTPYLYQRLAELSRGDNKRSAPSSSQQLSPMPTTTRSPCGCRTCHSG